jgi:hypothetical protein
MCRKEQTLNLAKAMCYFFYLSSLKAMCFFYLCKLEMVGMIMCGKEHTGNIIENNTFICEKQQNIVSKA